MKLFQTEEKKEERKDSEKKKKDNERTIIDKTIKASRRELLQT